MLFFKADLKFYIYKFIYVQSFLSARLSVQSSELVPLPHHPQAKVAPPTVWVLVGETLACEGGVGDPILIKWQHSGTLCRYTQIPLRQCVTLSALTPCLYLFGQLFVCLLGIEIEEHFALEHPNKPDPFYCLACQVRSILKYWHPVYFLYFLFVGSI